MFTAREGCYHCSLLHHCCLSLLSLCFFILAFSYCKFNLKAHRDGASLYIYICTYLMQEGSSVSESLPLYEAIIKELLLLLQWPESRGQCGGGNGLKSNDTIPFFVFSTSVTWMSWAEASKAVGNLSFKRPVYFPFNINIFIFLLSSSQNKCLVFFFFFSCQGSGRAADGQLPSYLLLIFFTWFFHAQH